MLRHIPASANPSLLVGFETSDDAGVFVLPDGQAIVQTVDFFTPIVDDPYAFGQIAAANALSDVYAMGGRPLTVLNIACFSLDVAGPEVWAEVLRGAAVKTQEAGAVIVGGHTVVDPQPKFGMAVIGIVDPNKMLSNKLAEPGDFVWLTKPLGTGIVTTAGKFDAATPEEMAAATSSMCELNRGACESALEAGARCATDITGFGLAGHLFNVAKASGVEVEVDARALPLLPGVERLIGLDMITEGGTRNRDFVGASLRIDGGVPEWLQHVIVDPQTSGGLAIFSKQQIRSATLIGWVRAGEAGIHVVGES